MSRRSGRNASKKLDTLTENDSGPNSPSVDMEDLSIEEGEKKRKSRALKTLKAKQDENSKFMSDFDPSLSRKAKLKISDKTYKPPVPEKPKKSNVYDNKGILITVGNCKIFSSAKLRGIHGPPHARPKSTNTTLAPSWELLFYNNFSKFLLQMFLLI